MTDSETIKALECCFKMESCGYCPLYGTDPDIIECTTTLSKNALDLIKRQKAEIKEKDEMLSAQADVIKTLERALDEKAAEVESLQKRIVFWREDLDYRPKEIRAEAIKEFAERLLHNFIAKVQKYYCRVNSEHSYKYTEGYAVDDVLSNIDNLVKEMMESQ